MQCNIDAAGKAVRLRTGIIFVMVGVVLMLTWALMTKSPEAWIISSACIVSGAFCMFEGWAGWCVVRAMGFKTKI